MTDKHETALRAALAEMIGQRCERIDNPYGSVIRLDIGPLALRPDDASTATPHGWRHLTVLSPWRIASEAEVIADWNVDGGKHGLLSEAIQPLRGDVVAAATTSAPTYDLTISWTSGLVLSVFADCTDSRDDAWFILGTDGLELSATPVIKRLPDRPK